MACTGASGKRARRSLKFTSARPASHGASASVRRASAASTAIAASASGTMPTANSANSACTSLSAPWQTLPRERAAEVAQLDGDERAAGVRDQRGDRLVGRVGQQPVAGRCRASAPSGRCGSRSGRRASSGRPCRASGLERAQRREDVVVAEDRGLDDARSGAAARARLDEPAQRRDLVRHGRASNRARR